MDKLNDRAGEGDVGMTAINRVITYTKPKSQLLSANIYIRSKRMKKYFLTVCVFLLLGGCVTTNGLNIISPTLQEDEIEEHVERILRQQSQAAPQTVREEKPAEVVRTPSTGISVPEKSPAHNCETREALINLLVNKGIITRKELLDEARSLK